MTFFVSVIFCFCLSNPAQEKDRQIVEARRMLTEELPEDNYTVLKFILDLLVEVMTC